ncbi:MAG: hypothetical protein AAF787_19895, partial [Chloroflexota bacterium]
MHYGSWALACEPLFVMLKPYDGSCGVEVKQMQRILLFWCVASLISIWQTPHTVAQDTFHTIAKLQFDFVDDVSWSPDGSRLAVTTFPDIHILDTASYDTILTIEYANVSEAVWNSDGTQLASVAGGNQGNLYIRDSHTGELLRHLTIFYPEVEYGVLPMFRLEWSPDDRFIVSDSYALNIVVWDLETEETKVIGGHEWGRVGSVDWSPESDRIVSAGVDGNLRVWDFESGQNVMNIPAIEGADWHPFENLILGSTSDNRTVVWDVDSGDELAYFNHENRIYISAWNHEGSLIATGSTYGIINVWDVQSGENIATIEGNTEFLTDLEWHPEKAMLATVSYNGEVAIREIVTERGAD